MQQIFKKIRRQLAAENSVVKYLRYAVGEILLVVIGILIAVQINNWNENRKKDILEKNILAEMAINLKSDLQDCQWNINRNIQHLTANQTVLHHLKNKLPYHDSLSTHYGLLRGNTQLMENMTAFENLKSIGFSLIKNDSLRRMITHLYSNNYQYLENLEQKHDDPFQWNKLSPQIMEKITTDVILEQGVPVNHAALMQDHLFKETIKLNISLRNYMIDQYTDTEKKIQTLINAIELELKNKER
jgi:Family of unknown function (DUF6090)